MSTNSANSISQAHASINAHQFPAKFKRNCALALTIVAGGAWLAQMRWQSLPFRWKSCLALGSLSSATAIYFQTRMQQRPYALLHNIVSSLETIEKTDFFPQKSRVPTKEEICAIFETDGKNQEKTIASIIEMAEGWSKPMANKKDQLTYLPKRVLESIKQNPEQFLNLPPEVLITLNQGLNTITLFLEINKAWHETPNAKFSDIPVAIKMHESAETLFYINSIRFMTNAAALISNPEQMQKNPILFDARGVLNELSYPYRRCFVTPLLPRLPIDEKEWTLLQEDAQKAADWIDLDPQIKALLTWQVKKWKAVLAKLDEALDPATANSYTAGERTKNEQLKNFAHWTNVLAKIARCHANTNAKEIDRGEVKSLLHCSSLNDYLEGLLKISDGYHNPPTLPKLEISSYDDLDDPTKWNSLTITTYRIELQKDDSNKSVATQISLCELVRTKSILIDN